jgi:hypothetical protein
MTDSVWGMQIQPPTPEQEAQSLIDGFGYRGFSHIPTGDVIKMLVAYQGHESRLNAHLLQLLGEFQNITARPILVDPKQSQTPHSLTQDRQQ